MSNTAQNATQNMMTASAQAAVHVFAFKVGHRAHCGPEQAQENRIVRFFGLRGQVIDLILPAGLAAQLREKILPLSPRVANQAAPSGLTKSVHRVFADGTSSPSPGLTANGSNSPVLSAAGDSFTGAGPSGQGFDNVPLSYGIGDPLSLQSATGNETVTKGEGIQHTNDQAPTSAPAGFCGSNAAAPLKPDDSDPATEPAPAGAESISPVTQNK